MNQEVTVYHEMAVQTASPVEVVIMLCDVLVKDLKEVAAAIHIRDIEERVKKSNHALDVLKELDLMLDFENGGQTAKELARVYSYVRAKLLECQFKLDRSIIERQAEFISQIRQAWQDSLTTTTAPKATTEVPPLFEGGGFPYAAAGEEVRSCSWSA